jgi:hypothetical protein
VNLGKDYGQMIQLTVYSKHVERIARIAIEHEENRIRKLLVREVCEAFLKAGFKIGVSHDTDNETERHFSTAGAATHYALTDDVEPSRYCWIFAYIPGATTDKPVHWVMLVRENVQDIISNYSVSAERLIGPINKIADKFD